MRRDAELNRERVLRAAQLAFSARGPAATLSDVAHAADVAPATLYRRFPTKEVLVHQVLVGFFEHLITLADTALQGPHSDGVETFLRTVGIELAENPGLSAPIWGALAPTALVEDLQHRTSSLLERAQQAGAIRSEVSVDDITAAVWAMRGVIHSERLDPVHEGHELWRRHLATIMRGFAHSP